MKSAEEWSRIKDARFEKWAQEIWSEAHFLELIRAVQRDALEEVTEQVDMIKFGYKSQGPEAFVLKAAVDQIRALIPKEPT